VRELQHQETTVTLREQIIRPPLAAKRTTMKAIVQDRYGSADVLEFRDIEEPAVGDDDVLVRVHAAGCGPDVWHLMTGMPYMARLAIGLRKPKLPVLGWDVAGTVDAVGANVTAFQPGDEVMGTTKGSFAELRGQGLSGPDSQEPVTALACP
jgi:NADPH:quinone reductase-like Zn-dependent oxidoreductase